MPTYRRCLGWALFLLAASVLPVRAALPPRLNNALNEQLVFIPNAVRGTQLETTIFKPDGAGPFPLLLINHGKSSGAAHQQERARFPLVAREFVRRGYVVIVPMRSGFSRSTGNYVGGGCDITTNGLAQAQDVRAALDYAVALPYVDRSRIVLAGQSHGGLTTMAFGSAPYSGVRGLLNFAGGLRLKSCVGWEDTLVQAVAEFGKTNRYPSLWFYGDNDSFWSRATIDRMHEAYLAAGGRAKLIAYGQFKNDAHALFADRDGVSIWWPHVERFLAELGLPTRVLPRSDYSADPARERVLAAGRAISPFSAARCRKLYEGFADADYPRAFALSREGRCAYASGGSDTGERALKGCQGLSTSACQLYVVDDEVRSLP